MIFENVNGSRRSRRQIAFTLVPLMTLVFVPWQVTHGQAPTPKPPVTTLGSPTMLVGDKKVTGVVLNEKSEPVARMAVSLTWHWKQIQKAGEMQSGSIVVGHTLTDAQGRFSFANLPAGEFRYGIWSQANLYVPLEDHLTISPTDSHLILNLVLSTGSLVTGRVVDGLTGSPMPGVFVGAGPIPPEGDLTKWDFWDMPSTGTTNAQGHYQIRVPSGDVFIGVGRITNNSLLSKRVHSAAQKVHVELGQTASAPDISVFLHPVIVCVGPDDKPVTNTTFRIVPEDLAHGGYILDDHTDTAGTVVLNEFSSGEFSIAQNGRTASGTYRTSPRGALVIALNGQTSSYPSGVGTVRLAEGSAGLVTGTVVSEEGKPISDAIVRIIEIDPNSHSAVDDHVFHTDASGEFRGSLDPNGEYHVYIRADGFNQVSVSERPLFVMKGATTSVGMVHLLHADGVVSGRVVDSSGKPMAGVLAFVRGDKTNISANITDDQGHFRIPNVVPGEIMHLELCLHGEAPDSGTALSQSNDEMDISGVTASPAEREIIWHPHS